MTEATTSVRSEPAVQPKQRDRRPVEARTRFDFAMFYADNFPKLTRFVMRLGASPYEAAEAAQTAFVTAFPQWQRLEAPAAWLRTVAARAYFRQNGTREVPTDLLPDQVGGVCPLTTLVLLDEERRVYAAVSALPPRQRQVMAWHLDGFSHSEIGAELGMSVEAVRQNYTRARTALKRVLGLTRGGRP